MPKESFTSLKQQNQDIKDKVYALSKEITQLKEKVRVDSTITFGAGAAATSSNSNNNASIDETDCLVVYNIWATNTTSCWRLILVSLINSKH